MSKIKFTLDNISLSLGTGEACNQETPTGWTNSLDIPYPLSKLSNKDDC